MFYCWSVLVLKIGVKHGHPFLCFVLVWFSIICDFFFFFSFWFGLWFLFIFFFVGLVLVYLVAKEGVVCRKKGMTMGWGFLLPRWRECQRRGFLLPRRKAMARVPTERVFVAEKEGDVCRKEKGWRWGEGFCCRGSINLSIRSRYIVFINFILFVCNLLFICIVLIFILICCRWRQECQITDRMLERKAGILFP